MSSQSLQERMESIRRAVNHPDLTDRERRVLATLVTYMHFDEGSWKVSRGLLTRQYYGHDNKGYRANIDKALRALEREGFLQIEHNTRDDGSQGANSYEVDWNRLFRTKDEVVIVTPPAPVMPTEQVIVEATATRPVMATEGMTVTTTDPYRTSTSSVSGPVSASQPQDLLEAEQRTPGFFPGEEGPGALPPGGAVERPAGGLWVDYDEYIGMTDALAAHDFAQPVRDAYKRLVAAAGVKRARYYFRVMPIDHQDLESVWTYLRSLAAEFE